MNSRIEFWPRREKLAVVGECLRGAFPPEHDDFSDLLAELSQVSARSERGRRTT